MSDLTLQDIEKQNAAKAVTSTTIVLSNVVELAVSTVRQMAKQDLSESLGNQTQTREVVSNAVANRIRERLGLLEDHKFCATVVNQYQRALC